VRIVTGRDLDTWEKAFARAGELLQARGGAAGS